MKLETQNATKNIPSSRKNRRQLLLGIDVPVVARAGIAFTSNDGGQPCRADDVIRESGTASSIRHWLHRPCSAIKSSSLQIQSPIGPVNSLHLAVATGLATAPKTVTANYAKYTKKQSARIRHPCISVKSMVKNAYQQNRTCSLAERRRSQTRRRWRPIWNSDVIAGFCASALFGCLV